MSNLAIDHPRDELRIRLPVFEGPMDLLLYLIKRDEIEIYDIPIERITKQYLEYINLMKSMNLELAGEFLVMAATLMYIKSRMLLPNDQQLPEDEADEDDPRWELVRQLVEYKKFKDAAFKLQVREQEREQMFPRAQSDTPPETAMVQTPLINEVGIFDLITAFQKVLDRSNQQEDLKEIFEERHTVSDKIRFIQHRFETDKRMSFTDLFKDSASRTEIVVTFLALLELIRLKRLRVAQSEVWGEIEIQRVELILPVPEMLES